MYIILKQFREVSGAVEWEEIDTVPYEDKESAIKSLIANDYSKSFADKDKFVRINDYYEDFAFVIYVEHPNKSN